MVRRELPPVGVCQPIQVDRDPDSTSCVRVSEVENQGKRGVAGNRLHRAPWLLPLRVELPEEELPVGRLLGGTNRGGGPSTRRGLVEAGPLSRCRDGALLAIAGRGRARTLGTCRGNGLEGDFQV